MSPGTRLVSRMGSQQSGTWGTAEDSAGREPSGALELVPSSPNHFILVLYMLMHTCPSQACLLFPLFTRCLGADSPEPQADVEAEELTIHDPEPGLQLKQKNHSPQIHNRLINQTQGFVSRLVFFRTLLLLLPDL